MLILSMPLTFKVGDSAVCRINGQESRVTYRDKDTLVIEPGDARAILNVVPDGELNRFFCGHAGKEATDYTRTGPVLHVKGAKG